LWSYATPLIQSIWDEGSLPGCQGLPVVELRFTGVDIMAAKNSKILFIKYHEAADQQPLSKKAAEKLGMNSLEFRLMNHVRLEGQPGERLTYSCAGVRKT